MVHRSLAVGAPADRSPVTHGPSPRDPPPVRILVVDDDEAVRDAVCEALTMHGYVTEMANGSGEVLERFRPGRYRLVVTDLTMPVMNGLQLAQRLRVIEPTLPILIFSGALRALEPSLEPTGFTIAPKPDIEGLVQLIKRTLQPS